MGQAICSWKPPKLYWSLLIYAMKGWALVKDLQLRESLSQRVTTTEITRGTFCLGTRRLCFTPCFGKRGLVPMSPRSILFSAPFSLCVLPSCGSVYHALNDVQCYMPKSAFKSDFQRLYPQIASSWPVSVVLPKGLFLCVWISQGWGWRPQGN